MANRYRLSFALALLTLQSACTQTSLRHAFRENVPANSSPTRVLAVYEPWFGHPRHINVGYSSQDPVVIKKQIEAAKNLGISGFVVDWYGDREPFLDKSYALVQSLAAGKDFTVAMMFDEADQPSEQATDDALAAFEKFHQQYLRSDAPGRKAYLEYRGRPVIFIFPKGGHTDWNRVRAETDRWNPPPLLIHEYAPGPSEKVFDGFFAWINPGKKGWTADGSNWGEDYLRNFYHAMQTTYSDKIAVGAAWAGFDDRKASWSLGRYMSQRCGATFADTMKLSREYYPASSPLPFLLVATWNDYEENTAIERGLEKCDAGSGTTGNWAHRFSGGVLTEATEASHWTTDYRCAKNAVPPKGNAAITRRTLLGGAAVHRCYAAGNNFPRTVSRNAEVMVTGLTCGALNTCSVR